MTTTSATRAPAQPFTDEPRPPIPLEPVESHKIKAIGYDAPTRTLAVTFRQGVGAVYHYPNVEPSTFAAFINAESKGRFFGQHLQALAFKKYRPEGTEA